MGIFTEKDRNATVTYVDTSVSSASDSLSQDITNVSGSLSTTIQSQKLTDLADVPDSYNDDKFLKSTISGTEWASVVISGTAVFFDAYDGSGGTTVGDSWVDVPLTVERQKTDEFSHAPSSSEVIVNTADTYIILARVTTTINSGSNRTDSSMRIVRDEGSGYNEISGTTAVMYNRTSGQGENTGHVSVILSLNADDRIKVQVKRDDGTSGLQLLVDGSSLSIFTTKGQKGEKGEDGAPGSGTTISLKDQGTTVSGSPFSILNFTGSAVRYVEEQSTGQAEIYIEPIFGSWYGWSIDESESSTNSTSWVNKATYTSPTLPAGYYRVGYSFEWRRDDRGSDFQARVQIDDTDTIMEINTESKDNNSWHLVGGFDIVYLDNDTHTVDLDYCGENSGNTSYIRRARIEFWRIS